MFDFAGVLTYTPTRLMAERAARFGYDLPAVMPHMLGPLHEDTDHPWHRIERGEITLAEHAELMAPIWEANGFKRHMPPPSSADMTAAIEPCEPMVEAARAIRAGGTKTAIISNNIREWDWRGLIDADHLVDEVIDSSWVGLRKPDPAIFQLAMNRLGLADPTRCLFLDDFEWNLAGAAELGMQTRHVTDPVQAAADLRALLDV